MRRIHVGRRLLAHVPGKSKGDWSIIFGFACKVSGYTIAFKYFFSERPDKVYKALDEAHAVCTGFYHQALGSLRGSRKKRAGTLTHPETEVVNIDAVSYLDRPEGQVRKHTDTYPSNRRRFRRIEIQKPGLIVRRSLRIANPHYHYLIPYNFFPWNGLVNV
jgi:hypothetical protein